MAAAEHRKRGARCCVVVTAWVLAATGRPGFAIGQSPTERLTPLNCVLVLRFTDVYKRAVNDLLRAQIRRPGFDPEKARAETLAVYRIDSLVRSAERGVDTASATDDKLAKCVARLMRLLRPEAKVTVLRADSLRGCGSVVGDVVRINVARIIESVKVIDVSVMSVIMHELGHWAFRNSGFVYSRDESDQWALHFENAWRDTQGMRPRINHATYPARPESETVRMDPCGPAVRVSRRDRERYANPPVAQHWLPRPDHDLLPTIPRGGHGENAVIGGNRIEFVRRS